MLSIVICWCALKYKYAQAEEAALVRAEEVGSIQNAAIRDLQQKLIDITSAFQQTTDSDQGLISDLVQDADRHFISE